MLQSIHLKNVGLATETRIEWGSRFNLITGDNGLGKSFLLDVAWWALTRTWAHGVALPDPQRKATIGYEIRGKSGKAASVTSTFRREDESWPLPAQRPSMPGIVVYIRIDGGFSVWDPARNYWRSDPGRPAAYHFDAADVWNGLDLQGQRVCEGLERDWIIWQAGQRPQFTALEKVLEVLSPVHERLRPGPPRRLFLGEGRDRPTLMIGSQVVPVALASAGVRRILAMAYFLVWAWHEHREAAKLLNKKPEDRFVILFDEPETHLHPRWQRTILPSLLAAVDALRAKPDAQVQTIVATHAPLVAASLEPVFDAERDETVQLLVRDGKVIIEQGAWAKQGDASSWLVSPAFGLAQARSLEAERAIEAAEAWMRGERDLPQGLESKTAIHNQLKRLLPALDEFWPRWIVKTATGPRP